MSDTPSTTVAGHLARRLAAAGARFAFGMPGGEVLPLLEALRAEGIDFVLVRHEGSAGFMADAAWQLTGAPGLAVATLGPGATNLVSGVAGALLDRAPLVAVTGQVPEHLMGLYTHQTLDQRALFKPIVKYGVTLTPKEGAREIDLALRRLFDGRPGPVHLNLPADVARAPQPLLPPDAFSPAPSMPSDRALDQAAAALAAARRPMVLLGPADRSLDAAAAVGRLVAALRAPALSSYRAKGLIDEHGPWCGGAFGLSPVVDRAQQALLAEADLILSVGLDMADLRPHWLPGWPLHTPVIAVDAVAPTDLPAPLSHLLVGPVPAILDQLGAGLTGGQSTWDEPAVAAHRAAAEGAFDDGERGPASALRAIQAALPDDAIFSLDVGAHRITACHSLRLRRPGHLLQSNGLASMGFGLPAAIAARLCRPAAPVAAITGDMGLWMALGELGIAAERGLDLIVVYLADCSLSLIALKQERLGLPESGVRFANPDPVALAAAFGGTGVIAEGARAIGAAVREAHAAGGLRLIEARIDPMAYRQQM